MDVVRSRVEGAARLVPVKAQGPEQSEAHRRQLLVDGAAFKAPQSEADCAGGGADQRLPAAGFCGRIHRRFPDVRSLPSYGGQRLLEVQGIFFFQIVIPSTETNSCDFICLGSSEAAV
jgi:hypothetical protein